MTKYVVVSDIHGNYPALQAVIDQSKPDKYICTGDVVGLMGFPAETVQTVQNITETCVKGNHDVAVIEQERGIVSNPQLSVFEYETVTDALSDSQQAWIQSLDSYVELDEPSSIVAHANPTPSEATGLDSSGVRKRDYPKWASRIDSSIEFVLIGHTHQQATLDCSKFPDCHATFVNGGSVGQPLNGKARYAVIDTETGEARPYIAEYDTQIVKNRLDALDIPVQFWNKY